MQPQPTPKTTTPQPQPHEIEIFCEEGNFRYSFAVLRVNAGEAIRWKSQHNFAVSFEHSPLKTTDFQGTLNNGTYETGDEQIVGNPGVYHYAVAVVVEDKVWLNAGCPEIIVK